MNQQEETLLDVLRSIFKHKKYIVGVCIIAGIGSIIISLFMSNYYEAKAIIYPTSSEVSLFDENGENKMFGEGEERDRLLSIGNSSVLAKRIVQQFDLYTHYDIDTSDYKAPYKVQKKFFKLYQIIKNEHDALVVTVEDKDPILARDMAVSICTTIDALGVELAMQQTKSFLTTYELALKNKKAEMRVYMDSLNKLRTKYKIYDILSMSEMIGTLPASIEGGLRADIAKLEAWQRLGRPNKDSIINVTARIASAKNVLAGIYATPDSSTTGLNLQLFTEGVELIRSLEVQQNEATEGYAAIQEKYMQYKALEENAPKTLIVSEPASLPRVKSRPKRSMIVIGSVMIAFIFSVLGALAYESYKEVDWKSVVES